jgi:hypothetical protein
MKTNISRRSLAAGLALAPVAGLPALAGAVSGAPMSEGLTLAIKRHKAACAIMESHYGPTDLPDDICDAESEAAKAVALFPVANDAELLTKLRYLLTYESKLWGAPTPSDQFGLVAVAANLHFNPEA